MKNRYEDKDKFCLFFLITAIFISIYLIVINCGLINCNEKIEEHDLTEYRMRLKEIEKQRKDILNY